MGNNDKSPTRFRWVALQLSELQRCPSLSAIKARLESLPRDLDETYQQIIQRIDEHDRNDVKVFIQFLAFSTRTMRLEEIAEAVSVDLASPVVPTFDVSHQYQDCRDVLEKCGSLVVASDGMLANLGI